MAKKKEMAEDDKEAKQAGSETEDGAEIAVAAPAPKMSAKRLLMLALIAVGALGVIGAGLYFSGLMGKHDDDSVVELGPDGKPIEKPVFYTLPEFLVNLNSSGKQVNFLKCTVILEVPHQNDIKNIEANLPRLVDALNTYLRELRPSDLAGSAGIQRLREELLLRANKSLSPVKINDVLFKEVIVQ